MKSKIIHSSKNKSVSDDDNQARLANPLWARHFGGLFRPEQHTLQFPLILMLAFVSFCVTGFFFLKDGTLYWDTAQHFIQFRDNLHSINKFGEIAWWFPQCQLGWPSYYYSILGFPHGASPQFGLVAGVCWLLGRMGFVVEQYHWIYVTYICFLSPLVFLVSVSLFARHFLKSRLALNFALILAAFSPGVMVNVTDAGFLEPASYSLLFGAAFLSFIQRPERLQFTWLCLAAAVLMLACNFAFLFWNLIIIPLFFAVYFFLNSQRRIYLWHALRRPGIRGWIFFVATCAIAISPNITAYLATTELVKPSLDSQAYAFEDLKAGNPLSFFTASLPGFGFDWVNDPANASHSYWALMPRNKPGVHLAYNYMGLLCMPLAIFGLLFGRNPIRFFLFLVVLAVFGVVNLSAYSPWFAGILFLETPLRAVNHYSDLLFRSGGFIVLLLAAAFGLDTLIRRSEIHRQTLLKIYGVYTLGGMAVFIFGYDDHVSRGPTFGFAVFMAAAIGAILTWMVFTLKKRDLWISIMLLLLVTLLDVSTNVFLHIRRVFVHSATAYRKISEVPARSGVGITTSGDSYFFVNNVLMYRSYIDLIEAGVEVWKFDAAKLFRAAHTNESIKAETALIHSLAYTNYDSLVLDQKAAAMPEFKSFLEQPVMIPATGSLQLKTYTYNRLELEVESDAPALLFILGSYSRYWKATVNGQPAPIARALYNFRAVPVPAGTSQVKFKYRPDRVPTAIFLAYALLAGLAIYSAALRWNWLDFLRRRSVNPPAKK